MSIDAEQKWDIYGSDDAAAALMAEEARHELGEPSPHRRERAERYLRAAGSLAAKIAGSGVGPATYLEIPAATVLLTPEEANTLVVGRLLKQHAEILTDSY